MKSDGLRPKAWNPTDPVLCELQNGRPPEEFASTSERIGHYRNPQELEQQTCNSECVVSRGYGEYRDCGAYDQHSRKRPEGRDLGKPVPESI